MPLYDTEVPPKVSNKKIDSQTLTNKTWTVGWRSRKMYPLTPSKKIYLESGPWEEVILPKNN